MQIRQHAEAGKQGVEETAVIGIIAGSGELPRIIAADAQARGVQVVSVAIENLASPDIAAFSDKLKWINVGKLGELIDTLKRSGVNKAIMAGKVPKSLLYTTKVSPDLRAIKLLFSLKDKSDDAILNALTRELLTEGIEIIDTTAFSPNLLTPEGALTTKKTTADEQKDIEFGWEIAKEIGRLDIGQSVVVKGRAVMAVEAIEGTDEAILRGGKWAGEGAVVVKVSKPQQDMRLDVPTIGMETLRSMVAVKARVLAVEAYKSIMIDRETMIREADSAGITIVGVR